MYANGKIGKIENQKVSSVGISFLYSSYKLLINFIVLHCTEGQGALLASVLEW